MKYGILDKPMEQRGSRLPSNTKKVTLNTPPKIMKIRIFSCKRQNHGTPEFSNGLTHDVLPRRHASTLECRADLEALRVIAFLKAHLGKGWLFLSRSAHRTATAGRNLYCPLIPGRPMSLTRQDAAGGRTHPLIPPRGVFSGHSLPSRLFLANNRKFFQQTQGAFVITNHA